MAVEGLELAAGPEVLRTALVCDALDALGFRAQCVDAAIGPLTPGTRLVGRAFPVTVEPVDRPGDPPYQGLLRAIDALGPGDVYTITGGPGVDVALWGELIATAAGARGAAGALCDGHVRDAETLRGLGFPAFCRGTVPYDIDGRLEIVGYGDPIEIGGVTVSRGQLVVGDDDGVVIVPPEVEEEAIARVVEKATAESDFRRAVASGTRPSDAFRRFGVL